MRHFEIITDSTCDLPSEILSELDVMVVPLTVSFGDERFLDRVEITPDEFYTRMAASEQLPCSSQPSPEEFVRSYVAAEKRGAKRILVLTIAEALSGTANSARLAEQAEHGLDVTVYNTRAVSMGHAMLLYEAAAMRDAGETIEKTVEHLNEVRENTQILCIPATLENLAKGGRCSAATSFAASLLDIRVILEVSQSDGKMELLHKTKGIKRAHAYLVRAIQERYGADACLYAMTSDVDNREGAEELIAVLRGAGLTVHVMGNLQCGPVVATHAGIGLIAVGVMPASCAYAPKQ